jgi:hypothetical protein
VPLIYANIRTHFPENQAGLAILQPTNTKSKISLATLNLKPAMIQGRFKPGTPALVTEGLTTSSCSPFLLGKRREGK